MTLPANKQTQLMQAFKDAYPRVEDIRAIVAETRNNSESLDWIALGDDLEEIVRKLITRADTEGWLGNFIATAYSNRPTDLEWQQINQDQTFQQVIQISKTDPYSCIKVDRGLRHARNSPTIITIIVGEFANRSDTHNSKLEYSHEQPTHEDHNKP